jgi:hypothetical protein
VLRNSLRGQSEEDQAEQEKILATINQVDLKRVFDAHFSKFLENEYVDWLANCLGESLCW